jgi:hypothetical protein
VICRSLPPWRCWCFCRCTGYFAPADAERIIATCHAADVAAAGRILRNFVDRYRAA